MWFKFAANKEKQHRENKSEKKKEDSLASTILFVERETNRTYFERIYF